MIHFITRIKDTSVQDDAVPSRTDTLTSWFDEDKSLHCKVGDHSITIVETELQELIHSLINNGYRLPEIT